MNFRTATVDELFVTATLYVVAPVTGHASDAVPVAFDVDANTVPAASFNANVTFGVEPPGSVDHDTASDNVPDASGTTDCSDVAEIAKPPT